MNKIIKASIFYAVIFTLASLAVYLLQMLYGAFMDFWVVCLVEFALIFFTGLVTDRYYQEL